MAQILLVDDDQDIIEMNRTVFAQRGHEVQVAFSAAEAKMRTVAQRTLNEPSMRSSLARKL